MSDSQNTAQSELQVMNFFAAALQDKVLLDRLMEAMDAKDKAAIMAMAAERGYKGLPENKLFQKNKRQHLYKNDNHYEGSEKGVAYSNPFLTPQLVINNLFTYSERVKW